MRKSKYSSVITEVNGIKFHSKKEARRYTELRLLANQGIISELRLQVPYELNTGGTFSYKYKADFVYKQDGIEYVEDCKGYSTPEFRKKMKLMEKVHGIKIKLT